MIYSPLRAQLTLARALARADRIVDVEQSQIAVLDADGLILAINSTWRCFALDQNLDDDSLGVGRNYLEICDRAVVEGVTESAQVAQLIRDVLSNRRNSAFLRYTCPDNNAYEYELRILSFVENRQIRAAVVHSPV